MPTRGTSSPGSEPSWPASSTGKTGTGSSAPWAGASTAASGPWWRASAAWCQTRSRRLRRLSLQPPEKAFQGLPLALPIVAAQHIPGLLEQAKVRLCKLMNRETNVLLLDEPTSALDPEMVNEVLDVIKSLAETNMTIVMVTHEMGLARDAADTVVFMENGLVVDEGAPAYLFGPDSNERVQAFLSKIL